MCMTGIVHPKVNITSYVFDWEGGAVRLLWLESWICNPKVVVWVSGPTGFVGGGIE